jgi:hypothetical protein
MKSSAGVARPRSSLGSRSSAAQLGDD